MVGDKPLTSLTCDNGDDEEHVACMCAGPWCPPHCAECRAPSTMFAILTGGQGGEGGSPLLWGCTTHMAGTHDQWLQPMVRARHLGHLVRACSATLAFMALCSIIWYAGSDWGWSRGVPVTGGGMRSNTPPLLSLWSPSCHMVTASGCAQVPMCPRDWASLLPPFPSGLFGVA